MVDEPTFLKSCHS